MVEVSEHPRMRSSFFFLGTAWKKNGQIGDRRSEKWLETWGENNKAYEAVVEDLSLNENVI